MENEDTKRNREELKKKLHDLIDGIEDEHILNMLNKDVINYMVSTMDEEINDDEDEPDDDLTEEQQAKLEQAIKEADEGKTISYEEFKKSMSRCLTD